MLISFSMLSVTMRPLHLQRFSLLDYRLSVINMILIYGLITTQIEVVTMHANDYDKSTMTLPTAKTTKETMVKTVRMPVTNVTTNATNTTNISSMHPKTTKTTVTTSNVASIISLNRTSSAIFMSDDAIVSVSEPSNGNSNSNSNINKNTDNCTNVAINVDVNNFQIGTAYENNQNMNAHLLQQTSTDVVVKRKRWIRDLLATTTKNTTELTSLTTTSGAMTITTTVAKNTPVALTLSDETQNNSFIIPKLSASAFTKSELESAFTNNSDSPQLQQQQSKLNKQHKESRILSRPKRFLTFPEGASFSATVCITVGVVGNIDYTYMAYGLNWGVAYDLPNTSWVLNNLHGFSRHPVPATIIRRRTRRALYREIESLIDIMGYNGRDCVLRALCESKQYFRKNKLSMIGEMLRVIFSLPKQRLFTREIHENAEIKLYDHAYRHTRDVECREQYECSFSLLELAFGKYSNPPPSYYQ